MVFDFLSVVCDDYSRCQFYKQNLEVYGGLKNLVLDFFIIDCDCYMLRLYFYNIFKCLYVYMFICYMLICFS